MPWKEASIMTLRTEFVKLVEAGTVGKRELCRRFGITPRTGYKWIKRYEEQGDEGLEDRTKRPHNSPARTSPAVEAEVVAVRKEHPEWGGRKIHAILSRESDKVPPPSTITAILHRHNLISVEEGVKHGPWERFEHAAPNDLWQMDFKGHFSTDSGRCHPLTVLDDHSRFALAIDACIDELGGTVRERLTNVFRFYGLPRQMVMDNGSPWGNGPECPYTRLTVWLLRLGISVSHGRPYHPQTQGKDERFHRTLKAEVLNGRVFSDVAHCQKSFDRWRAVYNYQRPHQALDYATPGSRYTPSRRTFPETLPPIEYGPDDQVRKVQEEGEIFFKGRVFPVSKAFAGLPVAVRPTEVDGRWQVFFLTHPIAWADFRTAFID